MKKMFRLVTAIDEYSGPSHLRPPAADFPEAQSIVPMHKTPERPPDPDPNVTRSLEQTFEVST
jgi:hypothetical protein